MLVIDILVGHNLGYTQLCLVVLMKKKVDLHIACGHVRENFFDSARRYQFYWRFICKTLNDTVLSKIQATELGRFKVSSGGSEGKKMAIFEVV